MQHVQYPVVLIIRDGWGENHDVQVNSVNALKQANIPCSQNLTSEWPRTELNAHGLDVGLPIGVMGNSEVGHQNIGAGRIVDQEIVRINKDLTETSLETNLCLKALIRHAKVHTGCVHLMGLVSDGGVHSSIEHIYRLLHILKISDINRVFIHVFTDGRDAPPFSGLEFIEALEQHCTHIGIGRIATVMGRFWAMDRDQRWDRIQKAYECLTGYKAENTAMTAKEAVQAYYNNPLTANQKGDEFIIPTWIVDESNQPIGTIKPQDTVLFFNFRGDRPRELTHAFISSDFNHFERQSYVPLFYATMTEYEKGLCQNVLFHKPPPMQSILSQYLASLKVPQFKCAETEKYPHVTFFFNDYHEQPFPLEDWKLIPSPKSVETYDLKPEMSAHIVSEAVKSAILSKKYGLIVVNFANPDMVGHTGSLAATIKACEVVDACIAELLKAVDNIGGRAVVTADHGNADQMWEATVNAPHTRHTLNPVELIVYGVECKRMKLRSNGRLADVAPTVLKLMGLEVPDAMTGTSLITE